MPSSDSEASISRPADLRYVWAGGQCNAFYEVGSLLTGEGSKRKSVAVILISPMEGRTVVAFPQQAWDKKASKRVLPQGPTLPR